MRNAIPGSGSSAMPVVHRGTSGAGSNHGPIRTALPQIPHGVGRDEAPVLHATTPKPPERFSRITGSAGLRGPRETVRRTPYAQELVPRDQVCELPSIQLPESRSPHPACTPRQ